MPNFAQVTLIGHIGRDPELKRSQQDLAILSFSLAVNTGWGEKKNTTWWNITMFGKRAETVSAYLAKGGAVMIVGEPYQRKYTAKDGQEKTSLDVRATEIVLLGSKGDKESASTERQQPSQKHQPAQEPSLPEMDDGYDDGGAVPF